MKKTPIIIVDRTTPLGTTGKRHATRVEIFGKKKGRKGRPAYVSFEEMKSAGILSTP